MRHRRIRTALYLCALNGLLLLQPAQASHAYVMACCAVPSSVSVIDRATHAITGTLIVGQGAAFAALAPNGRTTYVANEVAGSISVLDTATGVLTGTISLGSYGASPYGAIVSPDGDRLYVTAVQGGVIYVLTIDTATNTVLFDVQTPGVPEGYIDPFPVPPPVISRDGRTIYIFAGDLILFDIPSQTVTANISLSRVPHPIGVAVTPNGAYAVVTFNDGGPFADNTGQFVLMDLSTQTIVKQIASESNVTFGPVVCSPDGKFAYFPSNNSTTGDVAVQVFDIAKQRILNPFWAGSGGGSAIAITPDGSEIELGESNAGVVSIDTATGAVTARTGTLGLLISLTVSPSGKQIYVPNYNSSMVEVIDPQTSLITGQVPAGWVNNSFYDTAYALEVSADGTRVVVAAALNLSMIDTIGQRLTGSVPLAGPFGSVAVSPHGDRAYVVVGGTLGGPPQIMVVATKFSKVLGAIALTAADEPTQAEVSPDSRTLYVGEKYCPAGGSCVPQMIEIDTATLQIKGQISLGPAGPTPGGIVISKDGATAYVVNLYYTSSVWVVNLAQGQIVATIPVGFGGTTIALSPDGKFLYESATSNYNGYMIDPLQQQVTPFNGGTGEYVSGIAVSPNGRLIYAVSEESGAIQAFSMVGSGPPAFLESIALPSASDGVGFSRF